MVGLPLGLGPNVRLRFIQRFAHSTIDLPPSTLGLYDLGATYVPSGSFGSIRSFRLSADGGVFKPRLRRIRRATGSGIPSYSPRQLSIRAIMSAGARTA